MTRSRSVLMGTRIRTGDVQQKYNDLIEPISFADGSLWHPQPQAALDDIEGGQQLINHSGRSIRARVDPAGLAHELVPLDPRARQLPRPDFPRHGLIGHDSDANPGLDHGLDDLDVF